MTDKDKKTVSQAINMLIPILRKYDKDKSGGLDMSITDKSGKDIALNLFASPSLQQQEVYGFNAQLELNKLNSIAKDLRSPSIVLTDTLKDQIRESEKVITAISSPILNMRCEIALTKISRYIGEEAMKDIFKP